jgi:hypothetical protein
MEQRSGFLLRQEQELFSRPPRTDRLCGPSNLPFSDYRNLLHIYQNSQTLELITQQQEPKDYVEFYLHTNQRLHGWQ